MLSLIQLTPGMDDATLVNTINKNFEQLQNESRTKTSKDSAGTRRLLIGRPVNGDHDIIAITIPGKDVVEETTVR
jgi:hypothetical protein|uniref:Baseplate protein n=1 Tax=Podoviridae sp. ctdDI2 TaxID=2826567 RepID=A0A8S5NQ44_9CAUD|nr:MAG TPA: baseplate protein [Podoviridae sp. ctdDI2]DAJ82457.1 MAG TPA: baseplate protein [Caudoviricetes sp.]DAK14779.1 MAG TPA: baseplate protein [Caudoviricetes sp.]DAK25876.1 MAG TPA: baseplate protein [Caudoviricetes sp.]DAN20798.1 MAG TPA: baseplate protein [Caudoviricetes sp.]